jgi:hypothetical protein
MSTHLRLIACYIALASCCAFLFPLISPDSFRHVFSMRLERSPRLDSAELPSTIRFILLDSTRVSVRIFDISWTVFFVIGRLRLSRASFVALAGGLFTFEYHLNKLAVFFVISSALTSITIRWYDLGPYISIPLNPDFSKAVSNPNRAFDFNTQDISRLVVFRMGELRDLFRGRLFLYLVVFIRVYYPTSATLTRSSRWFYRFLSWFFLVYSVGGDGIFGDGRLLLVSSFFVELIFILLAALFSLQSYTAATELFWLKHLRYGAYCWWF